MHLTNSTTPWQPSANKISQSKSSHKATLRTLCAQLVNEKRGDQKCLCRYSPPRSSMCYTLMRGESRGRNTNMDIPTMPHAHGRDIYLSFQRRLRTGRDSPHTQNYTHRGLTLLCFILFYFLIYFFLLHNLYLFISSFA